MALGDHYLENDGVTICMFGDGATNIGYFHEALNLSKVWNLPVLWVCENNQYGMGTTVERASAVSEIRQKAEGYCIPNSRVDGMNLMTVYEAAKEALEQVRGGNGPYLLEIVTYRYRGHSMGDPERYREADEVKEWQENDPIGIYNRHLVKEKVAKKAELEEIEARVESEVEAAIEFAESSPDPEPEELFTDIYVEEVS
jgi:pyruvate dehydrogenase E1 component alpha subunit